MADAFCVSVFMLRIITLCFKTRKNLSENGAKRPVIIQEKMTEKIKHIDPDHLIPMDLCAGIFPLEIDLAYARDEAPNIFGKIYSDDAKLWLHRDMAKLICLAARICHEETGCTLVLYDGLRTKEAQEKIAQSKIVKANPQWMVQPRLLSPPGEGAHPRAMAIDASLKDSNGDLVDMGTDFDYLAHNQSPKHNPAHREYERLEKQHKQNRKMLDSAIKSAAQKLGLRINLLDQEWWDFRFKKADYLGYAPLCDKDLPPEMRMVNTVPISDDDFEKEYKPRVDAIKAGLDKLPNIAPGVSPP